MRTATPPISRTARTTTDLELSALTEEMNAQGVYFLDMGPVFDSLGHPPEFSSRVDNHYGLLGAYETYRAAVQKINGDYGLALSFPEEGTDVTFSALPNPYMGSRTRKLLGLRGDDEKLLTAAFREDIPVTPALTTGRRWPPQSTPFPPPRMKP